MKLVLPGKANSCCGNCVCSNTITNTLHTPRHTCTKIFQSQKNYCADASCVVCLYSASLTHISISGPFTRKWPILSSVSIDYTQLHFVSCTSPDTQTHTRVWVSEDSGLFLFRQQPCGGNTQSVINHGRCLWEGSGTFLLHCTDKLHYHQLKNPKLMRDTHIHTSSVCTRLHNGLYHLYGHVLTH